MFKFAFRNVLRNRKRSLITAVAVMVGAIVITLSEGWVYGMLDMFIQNYVNYQTGHVRISTEEFYNRERFMPVDEVIYEADELIPQLEAVEGVTGVEKRVTFGILLGRGDNTVQAFGAGTDVENTSLGIKDKLIEGSISDNGIYIGKGLAEKLEVSIGEELLLATQTSEGGLNAIKLPVSGIFDMKISLYNENFFFINEEAADTLLKLYGGTTAIYIFLEKQEMLDEAMIEINDIIPDYAIALSFKEQMGEFWTTLEISSNIFKFFEALILFLASFVIINTMMMAIFERIHEIGTLKAIGMTDKQLFLNFTLEGVIIGAGGAVSGGIIGFLLVLLTGRNGLDFSSFMSDVDMIFEYVIKPRITFSQITFVVGISIIIPALTAMIPARYVKKFTPSEALRD